MGEPRTNQSSIRVNQVEPRGSVDLTIISKLTSTFMGTKPFVWCMMLCAAAVSGHNLASGAPCPCSEPASLQVFGLKLRLKGIAIFLGLVVTLSGLILCRYIVKMNRRRGELSRPQEEEHPLW